MPSCSIDWEPYYFPNAWALLRALERNAQDQGVTISPPGIEGWSPANRHCAAELLQPASYPPPL